MLHNNWFIRFLFIHKWLCLFLMEHLWVLGLHLLVNILQWKHFILPIYLMIIGTLDCFTHIIKWLRTIGAFKEHLVLVIMMSGITLTLLDISITDWNMDVIVASRYACGLLQWLMDIELPTVLIGTYIVNIILSLVYIKLWEAVEFFKL